MCDRLLRAVDFESVLASPIRARSAHFAAHHLAQAPEPSKRALARSVVSMLSTDDPDACAQPVEDPRPPQPAPMRWWFAAVVPKRHARKAATRNLLRRQIRGALLTHRDSLARGIWLVRLRAPFDARAFRSATSVALRIAARHELDGLLMRAAT
jgi:ribonuclease P protein component